jgi:hypothetical protein
VPGRNDAGARSEKEMKQERRDQRYINTNAEHIASCKQDTMLIIETILMAMSPFFVRLQ